jgi:hypothetical protein
VALIDLLTAMLFIMGPTTAFGSAKAAHAGFAGYVAVVTVGLITGSASVYVYRSVLFQLYERYLRPDLQPSRRTEILTTLAFFAFTLVCLVAWAAVSGWASSAILRHMI